MIPEDGIVVYADQNGRPLITASKYLEENLEHLNKRSEIIARLQAFIERHRATLAGMDWHVSWGEEIRLSFSYYRNEKSTPAKIAALWPEAKWSRVTPRYQNHDRPPTRDWVATVDGVLLRMEHAESFAPVHVPADGEISPGGVS